MGLADLLAGPPKDARAQLIDSLTSLENRSRKELRCMQEQCAGLLATVEPSQEAAFRRLLCGTESHQHICTLQYISRKMQQFLSDASLKTEVLGRAIQRSIQFFRSFDRDAFDAEQVVEFRDEFLRNLLDFERQASAFGPTLDCLCEDAGPAFDALKDAQERHLSREMILAAEILEKRSMLEQVAKAREVLISIGALRGIADRAMTQFLRQVDRPN